MSEEATVEETVENSVEAIRRSLQEETFELEANADDLDREAYGRELGSQMGREVGGVVGRELGRVLVRSAREREDWRAVLGDARRFLVAVAKDVLRNAVAQASFSEIRERVTAAVPTDALESAADDASEAADEASEASEAASEAGEAASEATSEAASEAASEAGEAASEAASEASDAADEAADDAAQSVDDLDSLREETLRELLDIMSYSELQSIAKEIGVKANLDRETMTEEIVATFVDDSDGGDSDEEDDSGDSGSGDGGESSG